MKSLLLLLALTVNASAQSVWFTVANEGDTVLVTTLPITFQFGVPAGTPVTLAGSAPCVTAGGCWDKPLSFTSGAPVSFVVEAAEFGGTDPAYGSAKILQVAETAIPQKVTVNGAVKIIPALTQVNQVFTWTITVNPSGQVTGATCTAPVIP